MFLSLLHPRGIETKQRCLHLDRARKKMLRTGLVTYMPHGKKRVYTYTSSGYRRVRQRRAVRAKQSKCLECCQTDIVTASPRQPRLPSYIQGCRPLGTHQQHARLTIAVTANPILTCAPPCSYSIFSSPRTGSFCWSWISLWVQQAITPWPEDMLLCSSLRQTSTTPLQRHVYHPPVICFCIVCLQTQKSTYSFLL